MTLSPERIAELVQPYLAGIAPPPDLYSQLGTYLDLLLRWNARTNLTAIREPEEIVRRHFGESLFAGAHVAPLLSAGATLMDFGSGAGFPGLPVQLLLPELRVTLAESQGKKATFLREVTRSLGLKTEVWAGRVETMPADRGFGVVSLRAVDNMGEAISEAGKRISQGGVMLALGGKELVLPSGELKVIPMLGSKGSFLYLLRH